MPSQQRIDIAAVDPEAYQAVIALEKYVNAGGLEASLLELVKIRASQINKCAWCLDMHTADARKLGMDERKLAVIAAFREAGGLFTPREIAALELTEQVTLISVEGVTDAVWEQVRAAFTQKEIVVLIIAISAINVWNRMNVAALTDLPDKPGVMG